MSSSSALFALRTTLRFNSSRNPLSSLSISRLPKLRHSSTVNDVDVDVSSPSPIPTPTSHPISSSTLQRLHRLSALNPPTPGSSEESELKSELSDLIGLMELVKSVELPSGMDERSHLLSQGVGQVYITDFENDLSDEKSTSGLGVQSGKEGERQEVKGRQMMDWATNSVGDYYASRIKTK